MMRTLSCFVLLAVLSGTGILAQDAGQATTALEVKSQLVVLDTVVTDKNGKIIKGLTKDDFSVYENGVQQKIHDFTPSDELPPPPAAPAKDRNGHDDWGQAPLTMIVVDEMDTPFEELSYSRDCVEHYLKSRPAQLREPTILLWLNDYGLHALTSFTRDRQALLNALAKQPPSLAGKLNRGAAAEQLASSLAALQQAALFSRGEPGKKEIIWVGRSFPGVDPINLEDYQRTLLTKAVRSTVDLLLASRVTLYVVDPTITGSAMDDDTAQEVDTLQLQTNSTVQDPFASSFNLNLFVNETGGKYFRGRNDIDQQIAASEDRSLSYYTLTYVPNPPITDGSYRQVVIRLRNPDLVAQTKKGYYGDAGEPAKPTKLEASLEEKDLRFDLYEASVTGMQYTGLGVHIDRCARDTGTPSATCIVSVDTGTLSFTDDPSGGERTTIMGVLSSIDAKGKLLNDTITRLTLAIPAAQVNQISSGFSKLKLQTVVPSGAKSVRVVVRDSSGRIGTADVPSNAVPPLVATADELKGSKHK